MPPSKRTLSLAFSLTLIGTVVTLLLGACGAAAATSVAVSEPPIPQPEPTSLVVYPPGFIPVTGGGNDSAPVASLQDQLLQIDEALNQSGKANIVYNRPPPNMSLNETVTIELLLSPRLSEPELVAEVQESGDVFSGPVEFTPRMQAEIISPDKDAFTIQQIHHRPIQVISGTDTTSWSWYVTAKKGGTQNLTIVLYRYIKYDGEEYWRKVQSYRSDIAVKVTLFNRLQSLNWYWIAGILVIAASIPAVGRWMNQRSKHGKGRSAPHSAAPKLGSVAVSTGHAFISYRRGDSADIVGRISDRLIEDFGDEPIFKDVEDIPLGVDFKEFLDQRVSECTVLLAVIGDRWVDIKDASGKRRLEDPNDFVRIEIESALARDIPVIPLLVRGASMPAASDLPARLQKLVYKNGIPIRPDPDFHHDMDRLTSALEQYLR